jgi:nitroimidazol reductase NimA-like FMN-containing flavoprotein (pyridoxamine 5'-phosphate oxidase superfamily)
MTVTHANGATAETAETDAGPWHWPVRPDPGDLSRRLAARRAELRLSLTQVAWRARVEPRYLAYLENFPGHPDAATLRRLAAALHTTSAALLGAGQEAAPGHDPREACWGSAGAAERLIPAECYKLLGSRGIGRIAFGTASGVAVLPVNYAVADGSIVIRTGSGSLIGAHGDGRVSFEADHFDLELGQGWSVLVRGDAHRVMQPGELRNLREGCDLRPWPAGEHDLFVRIVPGQITGRRIRSQ